MIKTNFIFSRLEPEKICIGDNIDLKKKKSTERLLLDIGYSYSENWELLLIPCGVEVMLAPFCHCQGVERMKNTLVYFIISTHEQFELSIIGLSFFIVSAFFRLRFKTIWQGKNSFLGLICEYIQVHTSFHKKINEEHALQA